MRQSILERNEIANMLDTNPTSDIPAEIDNYHSLYALEAQPVHQKNPLPSSTYKATQNNTGVKYCLRRLHGTDDQFNSIYYDVAWGFTDLFYLLLSNSHQDSESNQRNAWPLWNHGGNSNIQMWYNCGKYLPQKPLVINVSEPYYIYKWCVAYLLSKWTCLERNALINNQSFIWFSCLILALVLVYDYHPGSQTLITKYFTPATDSSGYQDPFQGEARPFSHKSNLQRSSNGTYLPETEIWSIVMQLTAGLRAIHQAGFACRYVNERLTQKNKPRDEFKTYIFYLFVSSIATGQLIQRKFWWRENACVSISLEFPISLCSIRTNQTRRPSFRIINRKIWHHWANWCLR